MKKLGSLFNSFEKNAMILALGIMVVVIFTQVFLRYVFNYSMSWSEEFSRYLFVWFSWIGVSAGLKDKEHLRVELLSTALRRRGFIKGDAILAILVSLVWLVTTVIVAWYGWQVVVGQLKLGVVTPAMRIPVWIGYLSIPACSAVVGIRLLITIAENLKELFGITGSGSEVTR